MELAQDRVHWPALILSVLNFQVLLPQCYLVNAHKLWWPGRIEECQHGTNFIGHFVCCIKTETISFRNVYQTTYKFNRKLSSARTRS
jgi:hypothetical protein